MWTETPNDEPMVERRPHVKLDRKRWRVYFNRRDDFPALWCVDEGEISSQIRVQHVSLVEINAFGNTDMGRQVNRTDQPIASLRKGKQNEPLVWIEFEAIADFGAGGVVFYGARD